MKKINKMKHLFILFFMAFIFTACGEPVEFRYSDNQTSKSSEENQQLPYAFNRYNPNAPPFVIHNHNNFGNCQANTECCFECPSNCQGGVYRGIERQRGHSIQTDRLGRQYLDIVIDEEICKDLEIKGEIPVNIEFDINYGDVQLFSRYAGSQSSFTPYNESIPRGQNHLSANLMQRRELIRNRWAQMFSAEEIFKHLNTPDGNQFEFVKGRGFGEQDKIIFTTIEEECEIVPTQRRVFFAQNPDGSLQALGAEGNTPNYYTSPFGSNPTQQHWQQQQQGSQLSQNPTPNNLNDGSNRTFGAPPHQAQNSQTPDRTAIEQQREENPSTLEGSRDESTVTTLRPVSLTETFDLSQYVRKTRKNLDILVVISPVINENSGIALAKAIEQLTNDLGQLGIHSRIALVSSVYMQQTNNRQLESIPYIGNDQYGHSKMYYPKYYDQKNSAPALKSNLSGAIQNALFGSSSADFPYNGFYCHYSCRITKYQQGMPFFAIYKTFLNFNNRSKTFGFFRQNESADLAVIVASHNPSTMSSSEFLNNMKDFINGAGADFFGDRKLMPVGFLRASNITASSQSQKVATCLNGLPSLTGERWQNIQSIGEVLNDEDIFISFENTRKSSQNIVNICETDHYYLENQSEAKGLAAISNYYKEDIETQKALVQRNQFISFSDLTPTPNGDYYEGSVQLLLKEIPTRVTQISLLNEEESIGSVNLTSDRYELTGNKIDIPNMTIPKGAKVAVQYNTNVEVKPQQQQQRARADLGDDPNRAALIRQISEMSTDDPLKITVQGDLIVRGRPTTANCGIIPLNENSCRRIILKEDENARSSSNIWKRGTLEIRSTSSWWSWYHSAPITPQLFKGFFAKENFVWTQGVLCPHISIVPNSCAIIKEAVKTSSHEGSSETYYTYYTYYTRERYELPGVLPY